MGFHFHEYSPDDAETVAGVWSGNTPKLVPSLLRQILIQADTDSTVFDVDIIDDCDRVIRVWEDVEGVINDLTPTPASGIYTVRITNATADEGFTVYLCFSENG